MHLRFAWALIYNRTKIMKHENEVSTMGERDVDLMSGDTKYMISGDSISKGVIYDEERNKYVILEDNYVSLLQQKLKGAVRNTARFGNTLMKGFSNRNNFV